MTGLQKPIGGNCTFITLDTQCSNLRVKHDIRHIHVSEIHNKQHLDTCWDFVVWDFVCSTCIWIHVFGPQVVFLKKKTYCKSLTKFQGKSQNCTNTFHVWKADFIAHITCPTPAQVPTPFLSCHLKCYTLTSINIHVQGASWQ